MSNTPYIDSISNPWLHDARSSRGAPTAMTYMDTNSSSSGGDSGDDLQRMLVAEEGQLLVRYVGVDGSQALLTPQEVRSSGNVCVAWCCPCFISCRPCSKKRRGEYKRLVRMVSLWLCLVNLAMLVASIALDGFAPPNENYSLGPTEHALVMLGAQYGVRVRYEHEAWRYVTSLFLHSGVVHYLCNTIATLRFCAMLEHKWGTLVFAALYGTAGVASSILSAFYFPRGISVGASGAICGVLGAHFADTIFSWNDTTSRAHRAALIQALVTGLIVLVACAMPYVDGFAHCGGLVFGFLVGVFVFGRKSRAVHSKCLLRFITWTCLALAIAFYIVSLSVFFTVFKPKI